MAAVFPDDGTKLSLHLIAKLAVLQLRLFKNNYTPVNGSVNADFTEADFDGYAEISLVSWDDPFIGGDGKAKIEHPTQTFTDTGNTTPNDIYGYYVTYVISGTTYVLMAERFVTPQVMEEAGDLISIDLFIKESRAA